MKLLSLIALALGTLALLSGPVGAQPRPSSGQAVPVEWALGDDGSVTMRFSADEGVDPALMAALQAALVQPALPVVLWTTDSRTGNDHLAFEVAPPPPVNQRSK